MSSSDSRRWGSTRRSSTNAKFTPHFEEWASGRDGVRIVDDGTTSNDDRLGAIGDIGFVLDRTKARRRPRRRRRGQPLRRGHVRLLCLRGEVDAPVLAVHDVGSLDRMREYNQVAVDDQGRITFFEEKPEDARSTLAGWPLLLPPADAAADPAVPGREEQPRPAGTPRRVALPARRSTPGVCRGSGTTSAPPRPSRKPTASFRRAVTPSGRQ